jgi:tetratricopeptide (TPR) repeat protein
VPVGWFWYLGTLVPVLGLLYNGRQGMADRYVYIPHVGLFVAAVWTVADLRIWQTSRARTVAVVGFAVIVLLLGARTAWQTRVWRDDRTFWTYTARTSRYSFIANQALAGINQSEGRLRDALPLFARATKLRPDLAKVHVQFARVLARTGQPGLAASQYRKALTLDSSSAENRFALAQVLVTQRRRASARRELERALAVRPEFPEARQLLGTLGSG